MKRFVLSTSDLRSVDPSEFHALAAFEFRLVGEGELGKHLHLVDETGKVLITFLHPDQVDAHLEDLFRRVSSATPEAPFQDVDQGFAILIWHDRIDVFLAQGQGEPFGEYHCADRVPADRFFARWETLVSANPKTAFTSIGDALRNPDPVRALLLGNQALSDFPIEILDLPSLEFLDLHLGDIRTIPPEIARLKTLRWLDLRFKRLEELPDRLAEIEHLESVNLAENRLTEIPRWVLGMHSLQAFFISGNPVPRASIVESSRQRPDVEFDYPA